MANANARDARELAAEQRGAVQVYNAGAETGTPTPVEQLGLRPAVALAALMRAGMSEDLMWIRPVSRGPERFAPTPDLEDKLLVDLHDRALISIDYDDPNLALCFGFEEAGQEDYYRKPGDLFVVAWSPREVRWSTRFSDIARQATRPAGELNLSKWEKRPWNEARPWNHDYVALSRRYVARVDQTAVEQEAQALAHALANALARGYVAELEETLDASPTGSWPPLWTLLWEDDWRELWKEISLHECLSYLRLVLGEHGLPFRPGEKTHLVLDETLESFSVAQVWGMIWRAGRDAAAFFMRRNATRPHAANTVVGSIQRHAERALSEGWDIQPFNRDRRLPRSALSQVFFGKALGAGDAGFEMVIPPPGTSLDDLPIFLSERRNTNLEDTAKKEQA